MTASGVVGVLAQGDGSTVLLRADLDTLPIREQTGLLYAGTATARGTDGDQVGCCTPAGTTSRSGVPASGRGRHPSPVLQPTLDTGSSALVVAAPGWLGVIEGPAVSR